MRVMMKNKKEIEQECNRLGIQYFEALKKHRELVSQFVSVGWVESGKPIPPPKRVLDKHGVEEFQESDQEVQDARKRWLECCAQLSEA